LHPGGAIADPSSFQSIIGCMEDLKEAAKSLLRKYSKPIADRGGELEVKARPHELATAVTWWDVNIYDHHDVALDERVGFRKWKRIRSVSEAVNIVEETIQKWIDDGPPPKIE